MHAKLKWLTLLALTVYSQLSLRANGAPFEAIVSQAVKATVVIESDISQGSGVIVDKNGTIATSLHVLEDAQDLQVILSSGEVYDDVSVIAFDQRKDIVLIKIRGFELPFAKMGNSNNLNLGQSIFTIGAPQGLEKTVSRGIISALRMTDNGYQTIQTDASISQGSSGGGLFSDTGELIGVLAATHAGGQNLNFAIPINYLAGMFDTQVRYSETEFLALNPKSDPFSTGTSKTSDHETLSGWVQKFNAGFDEIVFEETDDGYVYSFGEYYGAIKIYDGLLWLVLILTEEIDPTNSELVKLLELSTDVNYAYFSLRNNKVTANFELPLEGSSFKAFETGFLSLILALKEFNETEAFTRFQMTSGEAPTTTQSTFDYGSKLSAVMRNSDIEGLRTQILDDSGLAVNYRAFHWSIETNEENTQLKNKRDLDHMVSIFIEDLMVEVAAENEFLITVIDGYINSIDDMTQIDRVDQGLRRVQSKNSSWAHYSGVLGGIRVYWQTNGILTGSKFVTVHVASYKPEWDQLEETSREFLSSFQF
ncbi:MAG: S1C family serine protease [Halieaceae bacterium]|nr:S1C family serine protease [Halieaceae bacterium]